MPNMYIHLKTKNYEATIGKIGASLAKLTFKGHDILLSHKEDEIPLAHLNKILIPWSNRIYKGEYTIHNNKHKLWINDFVTNSAIHGLCAFEVWQLENLSNNSASFSHMIAARESYPFLLNCHVSYLLSDTHGLQVNITVYNLSKESAFVGLGCHTYLTCDNELIDECEASCPKFTQLIYDDEYILKDKLSDCEANKFSNGFNEIGSIKIDNCFKINDNNTWQCHIKSKKSGLTSTLTSNAPYVQLFTAEKLNRRGLAVEPMTCMVNAFNQKDNANIFLEANSSRRMTFTISGKI